MKPKLIIAADLGTLKAFKVVKNETDSTTRLEAIPAQQNPEATEKISDIVSDQSGRFPRGGGANNVQGDLSAGERLPFEEELHRRQVKDVAEHISQTIFKSGAATCAIALPQADHRQILEALKPEARAKIIKVVTSNLTKTDPQEILKHFN